MSRKSINFFASSQIPNLDSFVITSTGKNFSIRAKSDETHPIGMPHKGAAPFSSVYVPQMDIIVQTATGENLSIGTDGDATHPE